MVRVLLAVANSALRAAVRECLIDDDKLVCTEVSSSEDLRSVLRRDSQWDVLILDIRVPQRTKLDTVRMLHKLYPTLPILVSSFDINIPPRHWRDAGASGFVSKADLGDELIDALRVISQGGKYFSD